MKPRDVGRYIMRKLSKNKIRLILIVILCYTSISGYAQNYEMQANQNKIDFNFRDNENIVSEFIKFEKDIAKIKIIAKIENDSIIAVYVLNSTKDTLNLSTQDSQLYLIQEAKDIDGIWKPIEYWNYSWCGNSYGSENLSSDKIIKTNCKKYSGKFTTEIRIRLLAGNESFYSNSIICNIDSCQFKITEKFKKHYTYKNALRVSDEKLAEKVMFLIPGAKEEYREKDKIWKSWITEQNRKRNMNKK